MRLNRGLALAGLPLLLAAVACAPTDDSTSSAGSGDSSGSPSASTSSAAEDCTPAKLDLLRAGTLTVGTDSPAYEPWFSDDDPTNGKGYESAVAYAVAKQLGLLARRRALGEGALQQLLRPRDQDVRLRHQPGLDHPGPRPRSSTSPRLLLGLAGRRRPQGLDGGRPRPRSPRSRDLRLGAQTGTTSLSAITDVIKPSPAAADLRRHQPGQAVAAQRADRRDPGRPAHGVLHHLGGDPEGRRSSGSSSPRPAARRSSGCCSRRAARWCRAWTGGGRAEGGRHPGAAREALAVRRGRRTRPEVATR